MDFIDSKATEYAANFSSLPDDLLQRVAKNTNEQHAHAQMLSGHVQGMFLQMISRMTKPLKVLEIGSFTGFSALCLAKGLAPEGILHTIECREADAATAQKYFDESGMSDQIQLHIGDARQILKTLIEPWDLIFIDADKPSYIEYYTLTLPALKQGGFMLADNVLFHGQVLEDNINGKNATAMHAFNEHINNDTRVEQVMLTVRDGITVIRKL